MNTVTAHLGLLHEHDKLMQMPLVNNAEGQGDESTGYEQRLDYEQLTPEQKQLYNFDSTIDCTILTAPINLTVLGMVFRKTHYVCQKL